MKALPLLAMLEVVLNVSGATPDVFYVPGSTRKICQLVGDTDWQWNVPTENLTDTRYHLWGTDLGVPFAHAGRTFLVFGDTIGGFGGDRDAIAWTTDSDPEDGVQLTFLADAGTWRPITIPGLSQGAYEVPLDGVSISNQMYLWHSSDRMSSSWLAASGDDGRTFRLLYKFSPSYAGCPSNFVNVSVVKVNLADWPGFPESAGDGVIIFGSGIYRASDVRLAFLPTARIEDRAALRYFTGLDANGNPQWSTDEGAAVALFTQGCVGELSVSYNRFIKRWILTYNGDPPRGINFRTAPQPWGPWSDPQLLFEPWQDGGYSRFMHVNWTYKNLDGVHNAGRENEWGGEYGPYQFRDLAVGTDNRTTLYFTMSTWNPYNVVLQKTELVATNRPVFVMPPADQTVSVGEPATFEAAASAVGTLNYRWLRHGTNLPGATSQTLVFTPGSAGDDGSPFRCVAYNSVATVTSTPAILHLAPAGSAPVPVIAEPAAGARYRAGQTIAFSGAATDAEDGGLPATAFRWLVTYHHSNYCHSVLGTLSGVTTGTFTVPLRGETDTNGFYRVRLTVTDSSGRSRATSVDLLPETVPLAFASQPAGLPVLYDGQSVATPATQLAVVGSRHTLAVAPSVLSGGVSNDFVAWSDGGLLAHSVSVPPYGTNYQAVFQAPTSLVPTGSSWRYLASGVDPGSTWTQPSFDDSGWPSGRGQLGFGDGDETTGIASNRQVTTYFRHTWSVTDPGIYTNLLLRVLRDDGVQVYLNGTEVFRNNLGGGNLVNATLAYTNVGGPEEFNYFFPVVVSPSLLRPGNNVLAAAVHQAAVDSSDLSFELELRGVEVPPPVSVDRTWTGLASTDWYAAGNWSPAGVPRPTDNLTINGGTVNISPPFTVYNRLTWNGGTMSGALTVAGGGVMQLAGGLNFQGPITNAGTLVWTGGAVWYMQAPFVNLAGALFDWQGNGELYDPQAARWFENAGTFRKSAGGGLGYMEMPFRNTGTVQGQSGTLQFYYTCQNTGLIQAQGGGQVWFSGGGTMVGTYEAAAGSAISWSGGTFTPGEPLLLSGPGQLNLAGATLILPTDLIPGLTLASGTVVPGPAFQGGSITNLTLGSVTLAGTNTVTGTLSLSGSTVTGSLMVSNRVMWNGGTMSGTLTVASNGVVQMAGGFSFQGPITNAGTVVWTGGGVWYMQAPFVNLAGALFDWQGDGELYHAQTGWWFDNAGTFRKSAGGGLGYMEMPFRNTGTVQGQSGTLLFYYTCQNSGLIQAQGGGQVWFSGGGTLTGIYEATATSGISLSSGLFTAGELLTLVGPGQIQLAGATLCLPTDLIPGLALVAGTILPGSGFQGGSITNLTLGVLTLAGTNTVTGTLRLSGSTVTGPLTVVSNGLLLVTGQIAVQGPLTNAGTVAWTGGGIWYQTAPLVNLPGALFDWLGNGELYDPQAARWFDNAGTLRKSAGTGLSYVEMPFRNTGTVQGQSGTLQFYYACQNSGTVESFSGLVRFNAYSETASANLAVSLGGTAPSAYGHLDFANAPVFIGQFTVRTHNGFRPNAGDAFVVLTYPSATTTFTCLNGLDLGGGILLVPSFSPTRLTLTATPYTVTDRPQLFISRAPGAVRLTWPLGFPGWRLLTTTNLTAPDWVEAPIQCGNQALVPMSGPMGFFQMAQ